MPNVNPGPASTVTPNLYTSVLGAGGSSNLSSANATLAAGPLNDLGASLISGYVSGTTNRLLLQPASGGTTINGLDASAVQDNFTIIIENTSSTDSITFTHLNTGSLVTNRFSNANGASATLAPLAAARATYVSNKWQFA